MVKAAGRSKSPLKHSLSTNQSLNAVSTSYKETKPLKSKPSIDKTIPKKKPSSKKSPDVKT